MKLEVEELSGRTILDGDRIITPEMVIKVLIFMFLQAPLVVDYK